jgi:hypothetical protein
MHTVFLPILLYVFVVFISWLGKAMLIPVRWFFKTGVETRRPIELTSGLLGLLAGICTIIAGLI